ncbi:hypothetical protein NliqN6_2141 [Naganishia liquefaciens]|uniref:Uncharacterized protein n=1 Tax=Naganishia liquefaciens TaxID=104408 RepID=A0A8H3TRN6_9TREE|nr:hypothetical protein NliqN6_2141 [Naganishia liquefaciens]
MSKWHLPPDWRNYDGLTAYEREKRATIPYQQQNQLDQGNAAYKGRTEFDVLKDNHRFIREDEDPQNVTYEERLARAYESKLFKEYALIDLKHYKSRHIALRWRTAEEVIDSIGETTCASLRCPYHKPTQDQLARLERRGIAMPPLQAFELPFAYVEAGEKKQALVKVKVCDKCARKISYKPSNDRRSNEAHTEQGQSVPSSNSGRSSRRKREEHGARRSESPRRR